MSYENSLQHAQLRDREDPLRGFRDRFHFPQHDGAPVVYFTGNSLGLQPKGVATMLKQEMDDWAEHGVEGHFRAKHPWVSYHEIFSESLARIVGARPTEVVAMNGLDHEPASADGVVLSPEREKEEDPLRGAPLSERYVRHGLADRFPRT